MNSIHENLRHFARNEQGVATIEFVMALPVLLIFVFATFDSGLVMAKYVVLENALDRSIRQVRLGGVQSGEVGADYFKTEVCNRADVLITDCSTNLYIEMTKIVSGSTFTPSPDIDCVDNTVESDPPNFTGADPNDIVYLRACLIVDRIYPSALTGLFTVNDDGGMRLVADTAFVVEPD